MNDRPDPLRQKADRFGDAGRRFAERTNCRVWKLASKRLIAAASGMSPPFVDKADKRSVFRQQELPGLLENDNVKTINGMDKFVFAARFKN